MGYFVRNSLTVRNIQYGVERFENGFLGAHMTHRTQPTAFCALRMAALLTQAT